MRKIFDWMREKFVARKAEWEDERVKDRFSANKHIGTWNVALAILDRAEQKWEEDCCEWKQYETKDGIRYQNCRATEAPVDTFAFEFCPYCGKKIKIREVE